MGKMPMIRHGRDGRAAVGYYIKKLGDCQTESILSFEFLVFDCEYGYAETGMTGGKGVEVFGGGFYN